MTSKITLLYLAYPGMGGLMCDLHAVPHGSPPFYGDAMDKKLCRPPWKPRTDGTIDTWLDGLRDRLSRLYLSVSLVEPKDKPAWCAGKRWGDCVKELVARAAHTVVITQSQDNYIYDRLRRGQEPEAFPWWELDSLAQSVQGLHIAQDDFGTRKGVEAMIKATGFRVRQMRPISRTDRTILAKVGQTKARLEKQPVVVSPDATKPSEAHIRRREIITNLDGTKPIGFVAVYFNACGFDAKLRNAERFLQHYSWMEDRLLVVELAYGEQDFSLTSKTANLLQLRSDSVMWHKENLMNIGTKVLRDRGYANVGYLDADLIIEGGEAWYQKLVVGMGVHNYMQVFENIVHSFSDRTQPKMPGAAANHLKHKTPIEKCFKQGGGWVVRGDIWDRCRWYDKSIIGSDDQAMLIATFSPHPIIGDIPNVGSSRGYKDNYLAWAARWHGEIGGKAGYPANVEASALPHGAHGNRQYPQREKAISASNYDPNTFIKANDCGVWEWTPEAPDSLAQWMWLYFKGQAEDGQGSGGEMPVKPHQGLHKFNVAIPERKSGSMDFPTGKKVGFVAPYFNYLGYKKLRRNYLDFLERFKWLGDRLLPMEIAYNGRRHEVDYPGAMQVRADSCIWHKENLLNIGCAELRKRGFENVGYLDGDLGLLTPEAEWLELVVSKMANHKAVQCFESIDHIFDDMTMGRRGSVAEHFLEQKPIEQCFTAGGAWMLDGGLFDSHGWFDGNVTGGGDTYFLLGAMGDIDLICKTKGYMVNESVARLFKSWGKPFAKDLAGNVGYVEGAKVFCAPHGTRVNRDIQGRKEMFHLVDPVLHMVKNADGINEWSAKAPDKIKTMVLEYFLQRREDG